VHEFSLGPHKGTQPLPSALAVGVGVKAQTNASRPRIENRFLVIHIPPSKEWIVRVFPNAVISDAKDPSIPHCITAKFADIKPSTVYALGIPRSA
jgi:hypothetical protein